MILIVGLGNPGEKYKNTRHNIGFRIIDEFRKKFNFPDFKSSKKFGAEISDNFFERKKIILAKPEKFMNNSGLAVKFLTVNYKIPATNLWIVHDDIDLSFGKIRISRARGPAGHKGVQSVIGKIGTKNFIRFRIGIRPKHYRKLVCGTEKFVLQKFTKREEKMVKEIIQRTILAVEMTLKEGVEKAMNKYNK